MRLHSAALVIGAIGVVTLASTAAISSAVAGPPDGAAAPRSGDPILAYLASLPKGYQDNQLAEMAFNTALNSLPGAERTGYIASADDVAHRVTTVYWNGAMTIGTTVHRLAAQAGITARVASWPYSNAQIDSASRRLFAAARAGAFPGFTVTAVSGFSPSYRGVEVQGSYAGGSTALTALTARATSVAGIAARVVPNTPAHTADGSRDNDFAPFYGGGLMESPSANEICSSGFSVYYSGADHTTTARHCRPNDFEAPDRTSAKYGSTKAWANTGQGRVLTASGAGFAWDGAWNSTGYDKGVVGYRDLSVGDNVCTDGGNSGVHCGVQVTNLRVNWNDGYGTEPTIEAYRSAGVAVIQGDSGGPVLVPLSNGTQIYAAGMIQFFFGTNLNPNCGGTWYTGNNGCSKSVGFTSMRTVVNSLSGAHLVLQGQ